MRLSDEPPGGDCGGMCNCSVCRDSVLHPPMSAFAVLVEGSVVAGVYVGSLAMVGFDTATRDAYGVQVRRAVRMLFPGISYSRAAVTNGGPPPGP
jgi:hypothetical protein